MKGLIIVFLKKKNKYVNNEKIDKIANRLPESSDITEKVQLYSIITDLVSIVNLLVTVSEPKIEPGSLKRIRSVMCTMNIWLTKNIDNYNEYMKTMRLNEDDLMDDIDKLLDDFLDECGEMETDA